MSGISDRVSPSTSRTSTGRARSWRSRISILLSLLLVTVAFSVSAAAQTINFETYTPGSPNGQDGWTRTGVFDHVIHTNVSGPASFGAKSLRVSNATGSGSFGDQTFSKSTANEAGESAAVSGGWSGGTRQNVFTWQFNVASTVPGAQQPGLGVSVAADRGDGGRMSQVRFEDQADGIHVLFSEYQDLAPFGGSTGDDANGCNAGGDGFIASDIATLNRAGTHTVKVVITFNNGPRNDVVQVYINGILVKTGNTWEDYYRYCAEQSGGGNQIPTTDSLMFRTATSAPATSGNGFLFDNFTFNSGVAPTTVTNIGAANLTPVANATDWFFYNDENDTINNSLGTFVSGPGTAPMGTGSAQISVSGTQRRNLATYRFGGTLLSAITELKFSTYNPSAGNGGSATRSGFLTLNVDFNNSNTFQRRISFVPSTNGTVVQNQWQEWDAINGGGALYFYSGPTWPGTATPGTTARTWNDIITSYPAIRILPSDPFLGLRVGEPYADGYTENIDAFKFGTASGTTHFNFDPAYPLMVDDDGYGAPGNCDGTDVVSNSIAGSVAAAPPGSTIQICSGTYPTPNTIVLNKAGMTLVGIGPTRPVVQGSLATVSAGAHNIFHATADNVTLDNLEIQKTDLGGLQELIWVQGNNFTAQNNLIYGPNPGSTWDVAGVVSRAFIVSVSNNLQLLNNTIHTLRQPAYMSGSAVSGGTISGNNVSGTKGWVVEGGNFAFSGNTWGEPQNQSCDIALIPSVAPANNAFYEPLLTLSTNNDNAFICAQYGTPVNGRAIAYVDDGSAPGGNGSDNTNYQGINAGIAGTLPGGTVQVAAGTYNEDVDVNKSVHVRGAGSVGTTVVGPIGGSGSSTFAVTASNVKITGFTITRAGNNTTDWNNASLNSAGVSVQGLTITNLLLRDNLIAGMRTGIDINNSNGHTIRNNVIDNNRTGMIMRNQTDNLTVVENTITNNWTVGILFLDATNGASNSPVQQALNCTFFNNNLSGNWYGQIVDRQASPFIATPGTTNLKNFSGNWYGTVSPVVTTANSAEPGYAAQIPVAFGGSAVPPGGQPDIAGAASANFDFTPYLNSGTDSNVETSLGNGTYGFQGSFNSLSVSATSAQTGAGSKIQEAIDLITAGGTLTVPSGTYPGNVNVNKALTITGAFTVGGTFTTSASGVVLNPGTSPGIINSGSLSLGSGTTVNMEVNGTVAGTNYDQFNVAGTVNIASNVNLNLLVGYSPGAGHSYTIINNDGGDAVTGEFNGLPDDSTFFVGANSFSINYNGGDGNDVVVTSVALCNTVSIGSNSTLTGVPVSVPVTVDDTTGHGLISTDFTVTYNPSVVTFSSVTLGTVTAGSTITVNTPTANTIVVSIFRATPFSGAGTLANLNFNAIGAPGTSSPVNFSAFKFNEGTPCISTTNGTISILSGTITGTVTYGNELTGGGPSPRHVPNTTLSAVGSVNVSTSSALNGTYTLSGMGAGAYTVTPSKTGEDFGALTGNDSALIAQHVVGLTTLNATQQTVADVSGAGGITSFDAALIARYVVALPGSGSSGTWRFVPVNRSYPNVNTNQTAQDYSALLMGDVTGNWINPSATRPAPRRSTKSVAVEAVKINASPKSAITVPVNVGDTTGKGIVAYQFDLAYNPNVIEPQAVPVEVVGTISDRLFVTANTETPGLIKVVVFGALPLESKGLLLNLKFTAIGNQGDVSPLTWQNFMFNEGELRSVTTDGQIEITAQPEDEAFVEGRLMTSDGGAIGNTRITMTDSNTGESWTVLSNPFGIYRFGGVKVGRSYVLNVESRQFMFAPQAISVLNDMTGVDLRAQE